MAVDMVEAILAAIREVESGGNYTARNRSSSASGAYQFIDSTWINRGGGAYAPQAWRATPDQQDAIARAYVTSILDKHGREWAGILAVPRIWYVGSTTRPDSYKPPGNTLTVGEYVAKWTKALKNHVGNNAGGILDNVPNPFAPALDATGRAVQAAIGALSEPFIRGLRRLVIIGLAVGGGVAMIVTGAWRGVARG